MSCTRVCAATLAALLIAACQRSAPRSNETTAAAPPADTTTVAQGMRAGGVDTSTAVPHVDSASRVNVARDTMMARPESTSRKKRTTARKTTPDSVSTSPPVDSNRDTTSRSAAPDTTKRGAAADTSSPAAGDQPIRDAYHRAPLDTVDAKVYQGWKYYNLNCSRCHGEDVQGTTIAPHLIVSLKPNGTIPDETAFQTTVCGGRVEKGMPSWCSLGLTPAQIDTIYSYVKGRSDAKLHPGRPARRTE